MTTPYFLRPFRTEDSDALLALIQYGGIDYPFWYRDGMTPQDAAAEHLGMAADAESGAKRQLIHAIVEAQNGRLIGGVSLEDFKDNEAEIGYFLAAAYQGIGLGKWAVHHLAQEAIGDHGLRNIYTTVHPKKENSIRILENTLGLSRVGYIEKSKYCEPDGSPSPRFKYRGELPAIQAALARWEETPLRPLHLTTAQFLVGAPVTLKQ